MVSLEYKRCHDLHPIFENLNTWSVDSSTFKFVPLLDGSWVERLFVVIYARPYIHKYYVL